MKKKIVVLTSTLLLPLICLSEPLLIFPDELTKTLGGFTAFVGLCRNEGVISIEEEKTYLRSLLNLASISNFDHDLFREEFDYQDEGLRGKTEEWINEACNAVKPALYDTVSQLNKDYQDSYEWLIQARQEEQQELAMRRQKQTQINEFLSDFSDTMSIFNQNMLNFNSSMTVITQQQTNRQNRPSPGMPSRDYNSYLFRTDSGNRQCIVTSSGYGFCP